MEMTSDGYRQINEELMPMRVTTVGLACVPPTEAIDARSALFTGFCVGFGGRVFWITASHVLDSLDEALNAFPNSRLFLRAISGDGDPIPFRYDRSRVLKMDLVLSELFDTGNLNLSGDPIERADIAEMDIAAVELDEIYVKGLAAKGMPWLAFARRSL